MVGRVESDLVKRRKIAVQVRYHDVLARNDVLEKISTIQTDALELTVLSVERDEQDNSVTCRLMGIAKNNVASNASLGHGICSLSRR
jgi:hypothetical protein